MNTPDKNPPQEMMAKSYSVTPDIDMDIFNKTIEAITTETGVPDKEPPLTNSEAEVSGQAETAAAIVSQADKRVTGLFTTFNSRNSYMFIAGLGWKKLATGSDSSQEAMNTLAAHCREKGSRIDFSEENGLVKEIYVW